MPLPKELKTQKLKDEYKKNVEETLIAPLKQKVISDYELVVEKTFELNAYTESVNPSSFNIKQA